MTLTDSLVTGNESTSSGGGINVREPATLTLVNTTVSDNESTISSGGGVYSVQPVTITNSVISDNTAAGIGGGVWVGGSILTMSGTKVSGNSADDGGGIASLGGVANISSSTFSGNRALADAGSNGGALFVSGGSTTLRNVTISGNEASFWGGGIFTQWSNVAPQSLAVHNVTITDNLAGDTRGAGIFNNSSFTTTLQNSLIANNRLVPGGGVVNCANFGGWSSLGHNLSDDDTCLLTGTGDQPVTDAGLLPLADNGGLTRTHRTDFGSAALDSGDPGTPGTGGTTCEATDQRGVARPQDSDGVIGDWPKPPRTGAMRHCTTRIRSTRSSTI
jgi:hypothetical protein